MSVSWLKMCPFQLLVVGKLLLKTKPVKASSLFHMFKTFPNEHWDESLDEQYRKRCCSLMILFVLNNIVYFGGNEWLILWRANNIILILRLTLLTSLPRVMIISLAKCLTNLHTIGRGLPLLFLLGKRWAESPGEVLLEKLGRGVRRTSQNPYPIYDQNLRFSLPYFIDLYISWSFFKNAQRKFTSWSGGLIWWTLGFCYRFKVVLRVEFSNVITRVAVLSTDEAISSSSLLVAHYNPLQSSSTHSL